MESQNEQIEINVTALISAHVHRDERAYRICKTLTTTVDPNGHHLIRPLDIKRLPSQLGHDEPAVACIFEYVGPNHLSKFIDYGPAWYNFHLREDKIDSVQKRKSVLGPPPLQTFLDFAVGAAQCIEMLHSQQIVHGEIRGDAFHANKDTSTVRLIHLGAGIRSFDHSLSSTGWSTISKEPGVETKLSYMSPEQTGRMPTEPDSRTDIYSLGILFRVMLLQKPVFEGETTMDIIQAVLGQHLPSVSSVRHDIPEAISQIIQKATAKAVSDRYQAISGLLHDLIQVRMLFNTGDSVRLLNWEVAKKDISPFFTLPEVMVGRSVEHDTIVHIIDRSFNLHQSNVEQDNHDMQRLSCLPDDQLSDIDMASMALNSSIDNDNGDSLHTTTNSSNMTYAAAPRSYEANTNRLRSPESMRHYPIETTGPGPPVSESNSLEKMISASSASVSLSSESAGSRFSSNIAGRMACHRTTWTKGRCEVITIAGTTGLGKSRLIRSVQIEARQRGYFAKSKFDAEVKAPFGPIFQLLANLFEQVFSEPNLDTVFHQILRKSIAPQWLTLHKVLGLPRFLLGFQYSNRTGSQTSTLSKDYSANLKPEFRRYGISSSTRDNDLNSGSLDAQTSQNFLRAGSLTKTLPLMSTLLDILRIITQYKFICICLDDVHSADGESLELLSKIISSRMRMVIIIGYRPENITSEAMRRVLAPSENQRISLTCNPKSRITLTKA